EPTAWTRRPPPGSDTGPAARSRPASPAVGPEQAGPAAGPDPSGPLARRDERGAVEPAPLSCAGRAVPRDVGRTARASAGASASHLNRPGLTRTDRRGRTRGR